MSVSQEPETILVTGDFVIDHHIYEGRRHHFGDPASHGVCVKEELGGVGLIHRLLEGCHAYAKSESERRAEANLKEKDPTKHQAKIPSPVWQSVLAVDEAACLQLAEACRSDSNECRERPNSAYAFWKPFPAKADKRDRRWRVAEAMGFGGGDGDQSVSLWPWPATKECPPSPTVLVIADGGMGFRSRSNVLRWGFPIHDQRLCELVSTATKAGDDQSDTEQAAPAAQVPPMPTQEPRWILLKMSDPVGEGDLWRELVTSHAGRLVVVLSATELRRAGVRVSSGVSWEQTLEDLHDALMHHPRMKSLTGCRHLIINFGSEAAMWLALSPDFPPKATFLFDPERIEDDGSEDTEGRIYGSLSCLAAMVAATLAEFEASSAPSDGAQPDLESAVRRGLAAMRHLLEYGHGPAKEPGAGFPAEELASKVADPAAGAWLQSRSFVCDDSCPVRPGWSLLAMHEAHPAVNAPRQILPLRGIARRVLIRGFNSIPAPILRVGGFVTADRGEIEALRSLRQLVRRYLAEAKADKPLSIGVFGPPGAGKSFAVKQLAKSLLKGELGWLEFNLSQFNGPADLIGALHQIRDTILDGRTPVAFFDEFDSQNYEWLKYLLAPMQDGRFQEGQISHPVGPCLFIFAGGTSKTFEEFATRGEYDETSALPEEKECAERFRLAKGPDFASRLDGRLNVVGPNPREEAHDIFFPVRRALFIRSVLRCKDSDRLPIDSGLGTALLEVPAYKHGARSLSKLLAPFQTLRRQHTDTKLSPADLPPQDQIALHVDLGQFEFLLRSDESLASALGVDKLADAVHAYYRELGRAEDWLKPYHDCAFADLPPFDQESNRAAARRLPAALSLIGLKLVEGTATPDETEAIKAVLESQVELLAEAEHDGWTDWHLTNGWTCGTPRDDARQVHDLLIPFSELSDDQKEKDRNAIRHYPEIAALAGLKIVFGDLEPHA